MPKKLTREQFIKDATLTHKNKYDYSLVEYKNVNKKIRIICPRHGVFEQTAKSHREGLGCDNCSGTFKLTIEEFISKSKIVHDNKYDYSLVDYTGGKKIVKIICPKHGEFEQTPNSHLSGHECLSCRSKTTKGEIKIKEFLLKNNIDFIFQQTFKECRYTHLLSFDFYLPNKNICIEYNGLQHYKSIKHFGGDKDFEIRKIRDKIKQKYCEEKNIDLLIIKYNQKPESVLSNYFFNNSTCSTIHLSHHLFQPGHL